MGDTSFVDDQEQKNYSLYRAEQIAPHSSSLDRLT